MSGDLQKQPEHKQCIANVHTFVGAFLFSLESQQTIGYGSRYMTEMCSPAFVTLVIQIVVGLLLQTMLAGILVAKILRPKKRKMVCFCELKVRRYFRPIIMFWFEIKGN